MRKKIFIVFGLGTLLVFSLYIFFVVLSDDKIVVSPYIDEIPGWGYKLEKNATELLKREFNNLKVVLVAEELDEEAYAVQLARIFIADLYTLNNKVNKYDVGGTQFVWPEILDNFRLNVQNTLYKYMEDITGGRKQELPIVKSIETITHEEYEFTIEEEVFEAFKIILQWDYIKDLEYDAKGEIIVIKGEKLFYVVEFTPMERQNETEGSLWEE